MLIFSRWRPDGGYDYFEAADVIAPLGDDLPLPAYGAVTKFGVSSLEIGHQVPANARYVGAGPDAVGIIAPMGRARMRLALGNITHSHWTFFGLGAMVVLGAWWIYAWRDR